MNPGDLTPLEQQIVREVTEKVIADVAAKIFKDLIEEVGTKIGELSADVVLGKITQDDAEIEMHAFLGGLLLEGTDLIR